MPPNNNEPEDWEDRVEQRLRRIESRLVQLMMHVGCDPYEKVYSNNGTPLQQPRRAFREQD
jgi:hypothetical protein